MKYIYLTSDKMKYRSIVARQTMFSETFPYFSFISFSITKSQHLESYLWFISHIINGRIINIYGKGLRKRHIINPPGNMYMSRSLLLHFVNNFTFHHLLSLWFCTPLHWIKESNKNRYFKVQLPRVWTRRCSLFLIPYFFI